MNLFNNCYVDVNIMHDILNRRSVTGYSHFLNAIPIDWYSEEMEILESAIYGVEFVAARDVPFTPMQVIRIVVRTLIL